MFEIWNIKNYAVSLHQKVLAVSTHYELIIIWLLVIVIAE